MFSCFAPKPNIEAEVQVYKKECNEVRSAYNAATKENAELKTRLQEAESAHAKLSQELDSQKTQFQAALTQYEQTIAAKDKHIGQLAELGTKALAKDTPRSTSSFKKSESRIPRYSQDTADDGQAILSILRDDKNSRIPPATLAHFPEEYQPIVQGLFADRARLIAEVQRLTEISTAVEHDYQTQKAASSHQLKAVNGRHDKLAAELQSTVESLAAVEARAALAEAKFRELEASVGQSIASSANSHNGLDSELQNMRGALVAAQAHAAMSDARVTELEAKLELLQLDKHSAEDNMLAAKAGLESTQKRAAEELSSMRIQLETAILAAEQSHQKQQQQLTEEKQLLVAQLWSAKSKLGTAEKSRSSLEEKVTTLLQERSALSELVRQQEVKLLELPQGPEAGSAADLAEMVDVLSAEISELRRRNEELKDEAGVLKELALSKVDTNESLMAELAEMRQEVTAQKAIHESTVAETSKLMADYSALKDRHAALQSDMALRDATIELLQQQYEQYAAGNGMVDDEGAGGGGTAWLHSSGGSAAMGEAAQKLMANGVLGRSMSRDEQASKDDTQVSRRRGSSDTAAWAAVAAAHTATMASHSGGGTANQTRIPQPPVAG